MCNLFVLNCFRLWRSSWGRILSTRRPSWRRARRSSSPSTASSASTEKCADRQNRLFLVAKPNWWQARRLSSPSTLAKGSKLAALSMSSASRHGAALRTILCVLWSHLEPGRCYHHELLHRSDYNQQLENNNPANLVLDAGCGTGHTSCWGFRPAD